MGARDRATLTADVRALVADLSLPSDPVAAAIATELRALAAVAEAGTGPHAGALASLLRSRASEIAPRAPDALAA